MLDTSARIDEAAQNLAKALTREKALQSQTAAAHQTTEAARDALRQAVVEAIWDILPRCDFWFAGVDTEARLEFRVRYPSNVLRVPVSERSPVSLPGVDGAVWGEQIFIRVEDAQEFLRRIRPARVDFSDFAEIARIGRRVEDIYRKTQENA